MRFLCTFLFLTALSFSTFADDPRYEVIFNGKNLEGWKGLDEFWTVADRTIIGQTTAENPTKGNTFLIWQGGEVSDFEFRCLVRFEGNNSGVQYRSSLVDEEKLALSGYQADLHPRADYIGMMYGEKTGRGIIAKRGQRIIVGADEKTTVTATLDTSDEIAGDQFNELRIVAVGNRLIHQINGVTTVDITDNHPKSASKGLLGLQLHAGPPMKVEFRNLLLRKLDDASGEQLVKEIIGKTETSEAKEKQASPSGLGDNWLRSGKKPNWIWANKASSGQKVWFRHEFQVDGEVTEAEMYATCDNKCKLFLNGKDAAKSGAWERPSESDVKSFLRPGKNVIAVEGENQGGIAGLVLKLELAMTGGKRKSIVTGSDWKVSAEKNKNWNAIDADVSTWTNPKIVGKLGDAPWGVPRAAGNKRIQQQRLNPYDVSAPPGFLIERVHAVDGDQGSWVSLTTDDQGRLYACDQGGKGLFRITVNDVDRPLVEKVSVGDLAGLSGAQGLLWAFDSLWFHRNGGNLYRLTDSDGDGKLDKQETYPSTTGGGEHGNHAVILSEDGEAIYMDGGNHATLATHEKSHVPMWSEGLLLPRMWDARGHARGRLSPGGWVTRLNPKSKQQTVISVGYRNQYDIALNRHGDMFTYDADMEWDMGMPWYRPTRICFVASGSDYGWRSGSGKWPTYYEDSLPPVVEIGPGSPTGVVSGAGAKFPTRYQDAILALDWTFGTLYAIHLEPSGAGYQGTAEPFIYGSPLPLTDAVVGHDGALYFTVGGRGAASALFRARYVGTESVSQPTATLANDVAARDLRRQLEEFHGKENPHVVSYAWEHLSSNDRFIRHAARIAVEGQPPRTWAHKVRDEPNPQARITAAVALARVGTESHRDLLIESLLALDATSLDDSKLLGLLRAYALTFIEIERPTDKQRQAVIAQIDPLLPHDNSDVSTELIRVLTYLKSKTVVAKAMELINHPAKPKLPPWSELIARNAGYGGTVKQMLDNHPPSTELGYAFMLRNVRGGWTLQQRRDYFEFLNEAAKRSGGASYSGFLTRIRDEALGNCSDEHRKAIGDITGEDFDPKPDFPITPPVGPGKKWTTDEAMATRKGKPDFENGRSLFFSAKCSSCHRMAGLGGNIGPDLTSVRNKFDERYLTAAIVEPSLHISDQYASSNVLTDDGKVLTGLVVEKDNGDIEVFPIDVEAKSIEVEADCIDAIEPSKVSQMPAGLLDKLNASEVRDLMAYIMAAGDKNDKRYK